MAFQIGCPGRTTPSKEDSVTRTTYFETSKSTNPKRAWQVICLENSVHSVWPIFSSLFAAIENLMFGFSVSGISNITCSPISILQSIGRHSKFWNREDMLYILFFSR